jgi:hypothetical protein
MDHGALFYLHHLPLSVQLRALELMAHDVAEVTELITLIEILDAEGVRNTSADRCIVSAIKDPFIIQLKRPCYLMATGKAINSFFNVSRTR